MALIRVFLVALAPANIPVQERESSSWYQLPSHFHSFCEAFLLSGLTGARILPVHLPDFHDNIFSRTGYISNQLLHHSMFQHKYMQCSAATILLAVLLCSTDCRKKRVSLPAPMPTPPARGLGERNAPQNTLPWQARTKLLDNLIKISEVGNLQTFKSSVRQHVVHHASGFWPFPQPPAGVAEPPGTSIARHLHHRPEHRCAAARETPARAAGEARGNTALFPLQMKCRVGSGNFSSFPPQQAKSNTKYSKFVGANVVSCFCKSSWSMGGTVTSSRLLARTQCLSR